MRLSTATDAARDRVRRGSAAARRPAARLPSRARGAAARAWRRPRRRGSSASSGEPLGVSLSRRADAGPGAGGSTRCSRTTSASSSRRPASARRSSARTSSPSARCSTLDPGAPAAAPRPVAARSSRSSSASSRRRSARSAAGKQTGNGRLDVAMIQSLVRSGQGRRISSRATARSSWTSATTCRPSRSSACSPR